MKQDGPYTVWKTHLNYRFVRWHDLPDIDLYMDQLITFVEKNIGDLFSDDEKCITPAMINNYVKLKLIPKPIKKRYSRKHLAYLMAITTLKQVLPIPKIKEGIDQAIEVHGADESYDLFCKAMEDSLFNLFNSIETDPLSLDVEDTNGVLHYAAMAFASKLITLKMIELGGIKDEI